MQSSHRDEVEISSELLARIAAIPDKRPGNIGAVITHEIDEAILQFYENKPKRALAKELGIGRERMKERYLELTGGKDGE